jgi:hypothetical protein
MAALPLFTGRSSPARRRGRTGATFEMFPDRNANRAGRHDTGSTPLKG